MIWRIITWLPNNGYQFATSYYTLKPHFAQFGGFLCIDGHLIQNGHHSKPKLSPYGAACLTSCKYPLPLNFIHFWIFSNLFWFYIGSHFEMVAILKILKTKAQFWVMIYFCVKFQKDPLYGVNLTFLHLGYHGNGRHFDCFQPPKSCHTLRWIFLPSFMKFDERNPKIF